MYFTQEQVDTIQLPIRGKRLKLEVLNTDFQTLATLEGIATGGSLAKDATNFVRRSGSVQMCVPNVASANTFIDYVEGITINVNGKIWLDKYVKVWTGIDNYQQPYGAEPKTVWYNFGICLIDSPVRYYGSDGYTMSFNLIDLAAKMNGDRSGQLTSTTTLFPRVQNYGGGFGESITTPFADSNIPIYSVTSDSDYVYVASYGVNFAYSQRGDVLSFFTATTTPGLYTIYAMTNNSTSVFCGGGSGKMSIFDKATKQFSANLNNPLSQYSKSIYAMVANGANICFGGQSGYFSVLNQYTLTFEGLIDNPFMSQNKDIRCMCVDESGCVYVGGQGGLFYAYQNGSFDEKIPQSVPFPSTETIVSLACDSENVYCGGSNGSFAIYNIKTNTFDSIISNPFLSAGNGILAIVEYNGSVYCGGSQGMFCVYNSTVGSFGSAKSNVFSQNSQSILSMQMQQGNIYLVGGNTTGTTSSNMCMYNIVYYTETRDALETCISEMTEFKRFTIYPIPQKWRFLPYDIKMDVGSTTYSALEQFQNILSGWQMYFDNEGVFTVEPIPSGANDIVYPFNLQLNVSDTNSVDFNNVRNQVVVYGRSHNIDFYSENVSLAIESGYGEPVLTVTFSEETAQSIISTCRVGSSIFGVTIPYGEWINATTKTWLIVFQYTDSQNNNVVFVDHMKMFEYSDDYIRFIEKKVYVFRIKKATTANEDITDVIDFDQPVTFELLGRQQAQACMVNGNTESPYFIGKPYSVKSYYGEVDLIQEYQDHVYYHVTVTSILSDFPQVLNEIVMMYFPMNTTKRIEIQIEDSDGQSYGIFNIDATTASKYGGDYTIYAFRIGYDYLQNVWIFEPLGRCPYVNSLIESGGEFDNIYADSLAKERAQYDLFLHSNMQNTITLGCVPDYSLDVNYRIKYNQSSALPPDAVIDESFEDKYFITKQVTYPLGLDGSAQTVNAIEIYDDFNYVGYAYDLPTGT